jgi:hypothetical protein
MKRAVVIFQSTSAYDVFPEEPQFIRLAEKLNFELFEFHVNNLIEMNECLLNLQDMGNIEICHLVIRAHGFPNGLKIGEDNLNITRDDYIHDIFIQFIDIANRMLSNYASIFLHCCLAGKCGENGQCLASYLSKKITVPIYAATYSIKMGDVMIQQIYSNTFFDFPLYYKVTKKNRDNKIMFFYNDDIFDVENIVDMYQ